MINLAHNINKYLKSRKINSIILSISGGVDSVFLLHIIIKILSFNKELKLYLYHINYNSHINSKDAQKLCEQLSEKYELEFFLDSINLSESNFESTARKIRYDSLRKLRVKYDIDLILTAHNYDDQIETLIMKNIEGADWVSMLGIRTLNVDVFRPLLKISKQEIYNFSKKNNLKWIEDPTNEVISFKRNNVRKQLKDNYFSKKYINSLLSSNEKSKIKINNFKLHYDSFFCKCISKNINNSLLINFKILNDIADYITMKLCITKYISIIDDNIEFSNSRRHWISLYKFMHKSKQGSTFIISKDFLLERNRSNFILYKNRSIEDNVKIKLNRTSNNWYGSSFKFYNKEKLNDENYTRIPKDIFEDGLYLTHWKYGDKVISNSMNKKLSDIFINNKVSNYNKKFYPIIRDGLNNILWIPKLLNKFNSDNKNVLYAKWNN